MLPWMEAKDEEQTKDFFSLREETDKADGIETTKVDDNMNVKTILDKMHQDIRTIGNGIHLIMELQIPDLRRLITCEGEQLLSEEEASDESLDTDEHDEQPAKEASQPPSTMNSFGVKYEE